MLHCDHINLPLSSPRTQLYPKKKATAQLCRNRSPAPRLLRNSNSSSQTQLNPKKPRKAFLSYIAFRHRSDSPPERANANAFHISSHSTSLPTYPPIANPGASHAQQRSSRKARGTQSDANPIARGNRSWIATTFRPRTGPHHEMPHIASLCDAPTNWIPMRGRRRHVGRQGRVLT